MGAPRQHRRLDVLRDRFQRMGIRPRQRLGQNFLLDRNQANLIARLGELVPDDLVLEVGPGTGFLTEVLAESGCAVLAVEVDANMLQIAREAVAEASGVAFLHADILAAKNRIAPEVIDALRTRIGESGRTLKCVSNLPYSAGTPFVANLLASDLPWARGVFLLQKEVADRLVAAPGTAEYGGLSISAALGARTEIARRVPPQVFWPRPKVESAVVVMDFLPIAERMARPWRQLRRVTAAVFGGRRKRLRNALKSVFGRKEVDGVLARLGIDPTVRGETLPPESFLALAEAIPAEPK